MIARLPVVIPTRSFRIANSAPEPTEARAAPRIVTVVAIAFRSQEPGVRRYETF
jgi:hypothetical protein